MKRIYLSLIVVMVCFTMQAQPSAGQLFIGGTVSIYSTTEKFKDDGTVTDERTYSYFDLLPMAGYFLSDRLAVGAQAGISSSVSKYPDNDPDKRSSAQFIFEPFARYYLISGTAGIFAEASLGFGVGKSKVFYEGSTVETNESSISAGIAPGVYYYILPKVALEAKFGWLGFNSQIEKDGDQKYINSQFGLNLSPSGFSFGFTVTL
jgi:outer membrane protein